MTHQLPDPIAHRFITFALREAQYGQPSPDDLDRRVTLTIAGDDVAYVISTDATTPRLTMLYLPDDALVLIVGTRRLWGMAGQGAIPESRLDEGRGIVAEALRDLTCSPHMEAEGSA